jgi:hypothetical protein
MLLCEGYVLTRRLDPIDAIRVCLLWNGALRLNKHVIAFMYAYTYSIYV